MIPSHQPAGYGRPRTLHLLDVENLALGKVYPARVAAAWSAYAATVDINRGDQVRIGCAAGQSARTVAFSVPTGHQLLVGGRGANAAHRVLIDSSTSPSPQPVSEQ